MRVGEEGGLNLGGLYSLQNGLLEQSALPSFLGPGGCFSLLGLALQSFQSMALTDFVCQPPSSLVGTNVLPLAVSCGKSLLCFRWIQIKNPWNGFWGWGWCVFSTEWCFQKCKLNQTVLSRKCYEFLLDLTPLCQAFTLCFCRSGRWKLQMDESVLGQINQQNIMDQVGVPCTRAEAKQNR